MAEEYQDREVYLGNAVAIPRRYATAHITLQDPETIRGRRAPMEYVRVLDVQPALTRVFEYRIELSKVQALLVVQSASAGGAAPQPPLTPVLQGGPISVPDPVSETWFYGDEAVDELRQSRTSRKSLCGYLYVKGTDDVRWCVRGSDTANVVADVVRPLEYQACGDPYCGKKPDVRLT
jgi:hypothetical protein